MSRRLSAAWLLPAAALVVWVAAYALALRPLPGQSAVPLLYVVYGIPYLAFTAVGGLIIRSHRASRVGWVMAGIGVLQGLGTLAAEVERLLHASPGGRVAGWAMVATTPVPVAATALIVVLLLVFPDGRLPSPGWRWFLRLVGVLLLAVVIAQVTSPLPPPDVAGLPVSPLANPAVADALGPFTSFWAFPIAVLVAAGSLVQRYRAGGPVVRLQIKWLALAAVVLALCEIGNIALGSNPLSGVLASAGQLAVVAGIGIAVLRHRLYDVDRAISRGLAYGWLAVLVTGIYVGLVVGIGSALGHPSGPDLLLSLVATVVVALVSLPLRSRLQELANRLVYGRRQAPYDSLAGFARRLADRYALDDVLPAIAEALGEGLRASCVVLYREDGAATAAAETWPPGTTSPAAEPDGRVPVTHQGEPLGALAVWSGAGLTDAEQRLLADLGHQAGLVLHNARLTAELERRLVELRASRLRLVAAQDAERRRLERDLHDGAQQELLAARMKLGEAEHLAAGLDAGLAALLREVHEATAAGLESIRRLSRGLYPPLLQSHGLVPALTAYARRLPVPAEVSGTACRFPADVETAVYFCCAEALQNVVKHAGAGRAWVTVAADPHRLCFEVGDDGHGLPRQRGDGGSGLQNMTDRMEALGGRLELCAGAVGTRVVGSLPLGLGAGRPADHQPVL